jgi:hypothetical protein
MQNNPKNYRTLQVPQIPQIGGDQFDGDAHSRALAPILARLMAREGKDSGQGVRRAVRA